MRHRPMHSLKAPNCLYLKNYNRGQWEQTQSIHIHSKLIQMKYYYPHQTLFDPMSM